MTSRLTRFDKISGLPPRHRAVRISIFPLGGTNFAVDLTDDQRLLFVIAQYVSGIEVITRSARDSA